MYTFKNPHYTDILKFGSSALKLLQPAHLTSQRLFRLKLFLKRASRKPDFTKRFVWFAAFPHLPLTKKPTGTRMGKGKGKLECWFVSIKPGILLFEFKNVRYGRSKYFLKQLTHKLGISTKFIFNSSARLPLPFLSTKQMMFKTYW